MSTTSRWFAAARAGALAPVFLAALALLAGGCGAQDDAPGAKSAASASDAVDVPPADSGAAGATAEAPRVRTLVLHVAGMKKSQGGST